MEIVYPNVEEKKTLAESATKKKKTFDFAEINRH